MARTIVGLNDARAVKRYSVALVHETSQGSFMGRNLTATDGSMPIHRLTDLENKSGESMTLDIYNRLTGRGIEGDNTLKGNEEKLSSDTMTINIDQLAHGVDCGGRMSRKRTMHDHREIGFKKLTEWTSRMEDELSFTYLAGTRGAETGDWLLPVGFSGRANNTLTAATSGRTLLPTGAASEGAITTTDKMDVDALEEIMYQLKSMANPPKPVMIDGQEKYILIMSPISEKQLRTATGAGDWAQLRKYRLEGEDPVWKDSLGAWGNMILYSHSKIPKTNSGNSCAVARNLLLGAQALGCAYGDATAGGKRQWDWHEETDDRGRVPIIDIMAIMGHKRVDLKLTENAAAASEFGVLSCLTYGGTTVS